MDSQDARHGLVIRDQFVPWDGIERRFLCRRCRARVGRPHADPITGELDFNRIVCCGPQEHEIAQEGDLVPAAQVEWQRDKDFWDRFEVLGNYAEPSQPQRSNLYGDADFEGFD